MIERFMYWLFGYRYADYVAWGLWILGFMFLLTSMIGFFGSLAAGAS